MPVKLAPRGIVEVFWSWVFLGELRWTFFCLRPHQGDPQGEFGYFYLESGVHEKGFGVDQGLTNSPISPYPCYTHRHETTAASSPCPEQRNQIVLITRQVTLRSKLSTTKLLFVFGNLFVEINNVGIIP